MSTIPQTDTPERSERDWMNRKETARYMARNGCPVSFRTLARWAENNNMGRGPSFTKLRWNFVRYYKGDVDAWIAKEAVRII